MPNISRLLQPLEDKIQLVLIPALTGCSSPSDTLRELLYMVVWDSLTQLLFLVRSIRPRVTSQNHSLILFLAMIPPLSM